MTIAIHKLDVSQEDLWDEYVKSAGGSLYHNSKWRHLVKQVFGHENYYLYAKDDNGAITGVLPMINMNSMLFGNYLVSMPYFNYGGVLADTAEVASTLYTHAEALRNKLGASHVEFREMMEHAYNDNLSIRTDKVTMLLDLPDDPEMLWKSIGAKRRAQVKRPIREGVDYIVGGKELIDDFYRVFSINMRDLGTPVYSKSFFIAILDFFPQDAFISLVRLNGEAVAAGFLIGTNDMLEIPWASTLRKVNRIGVNMFLYWNILKTAIEKKYRKFDFGRSSKDAGTLKFKKQWGGVQTQLYWYYLLGENSSLPGLNPDNPKYKYAISAWKKMPVPVANLIGPMIVKGLP